VDGVVSICSEVVIGSGFGLHQRSIHCEQKANLAQLDTHHDGRPKARLVPSYTALPGMGTPQY
jgi:hypothetical protein